ncbi:decarboxylating NADP(+)-dependent phosphogluconate dehydrogenase [Haploplasma modicum]|uniref:decarboxylating NADP(+)-dependent phosphogluconate dehydrogenase n=1 Tax=Haploplasma modicum TaxID=2150 RepID=UPI00214C0BB5|nr:decarboxylating NADP(+)-dependent phosphogluconate dehydrogenase [Haploplasma modicum]MCR1808644.1 decarboxylating NADP(+)-dependent phosphogluconate dehydrogenase [Haploplasma modicum]
MKNNIAMIGLAVMGENLAMNIESKGFSVSVYDIDSNRVTDFISTRGKYKNILATYSLEELVKSLEKPRKIMMMIRAGDPVDQVINNLLPYLDENDIIIDGGNSNYLDTIRRSKMLMEKNIHFVGAGVSGGEEGALNGPSIMPGGPASAINHILPIFKAISADVNGDKCSEWMSTDGSGHFIKMVHNGIEYGDMQLITETYNIMKDILKIDFDEMSEIFNSWNNGKLNSYLVEITSNILKFKDQDNLPLVTKILDKAGQKGTGKWTAISSLEENVPLTLITEAVYARIISSKKEERVRANEVYGNLEIKSSVNKDEFIKHLENALYVAKIISYAQGFDLIKEASKTHNWDFNYSNIAKIWRGGCIIRSGFLNNIMDAYNNNPSLENLLMDSYFVNEIKERINSFRIVLSKAILNGIPTPTLSSALSYFDSYTKALLPTGLIQAQRDYFGAHTYERLDKKAGEFFHTNWTGRGGTTKSTTYNK